CGIRAVASATARSPASSRTRAASPGPNGRSVTGTASARSGSKALRSLPCFGSIPEVAELHRKIGDGLLHQRDRALQLVPLGARHPNGGPLDCRLHLELGLLDRLDDALGELLLDADADGHPLLDLVAADLLDRAGFKRAHVEPALGELPEQHVGHLLQLELVVGIERELVLLVLDAGVGALEVEARRELLVGLVERVAHLDLVYFGDDVERRHAPGASEKSRSYHVSAAPTKAAAPTPGGGVPRSLLRPAGEPLFDAQAQGVELDEAAGILLVVGALVVVEGRHDRVEQRIGLRLAADHDHVALVELQSHAAVHRPLRRIDHRLQHDSLRRPPVAVVDQARVARHELVLQVRDLAIKADRLDGAMRLEHDRAAGRLVAAARFHADITVLDQVEAADAVTAADAVELG